MQLPGRRRHRGRLAGDLHACSPACRVRIMTGAPVPPGAEAVVPLEWTDGGIAAVTHHPGAGGRRPHPAPRRGRRDRASVVLDAGARLGPGQLGLLAAVGRDRVVVRPRPRVVVISTGSELVEPGTPHRAGPDPRLELLHPDHRGPRGRRHRLPGGHRPRRRRDADGHDRGPADPRRPGAHQRRRQRRCLRRGQGGAVAAGHGGASSRSRCSRASRRASAPSARTRPRSSRCPATRCRRTSPSRCSCAR